MDSIRRAAIRSETSISGGPPSKEKLFTTESHRPFLVVILVMPPTEADLGFVNRKKPVIGDGHAMRITSQIVA